MNPQSARAIRVYEKCGFRKYKQDSENVYMEVLRLLGSCGGVMRGIPDIYVDYGFAHTYYNGCVWMAVFE